MVTEDNRSAGEPARFVVGEREKGLRRRNVVLGFLFSLLLVVVIALANRDNPDRYNELLLWSVIAFVVLANVINFVGQLRYFRKIRDHHLEVMPGKIRFQTGETSSELDPKQITAVRFHRRRGVLQHIQILLDNKRGIRLEGYEDLEALGRSLETVIPPAKFMR